MKRLSELAVGDRAVVMKVEGELKVRRRLRAMGFVAGAEVAVKRCAPMGDPVAYELLGYCLSLRREEAALVLVEPLSVLRLADAPVGQRLRVVRIDGGWGLRRNLAASGIRVGVELMRTGSAGGPAASDVSAGGPIEVELVGRHAQVGRGAAARVFVEPAEVGKP